MWWTPHDYSSNLKLTYRFSSPMEFYRMAHHMSDTGNQRRFDELKQDFKRRWDWIGIKDEETLMSRRFAWKEKIQEIEKESQKMVQGYRKRIYKYDELDGDDINMERLYEHLPAMRKRVHVTGDKFGNFISLYFNNTVNAGITAKQMLNKTMAAAKLVRFFESLNKRVELIVYTKAEWPGSYKGQDVKYILTETIVKKFSDPLNISLMNTCLAPWFFRYWTLLFFNTKMHTYDGHGMPTNLTDEDLKKHKGNRAIKIDAYDCLSPETSKQFIKDVLSNEKTSTV